MFVLLEKIGLAIVKDHGKDAYEGFWSLLADTVIELEVKYKAKLLGRVKEKDVVNLAMNYIDDNGIGNVFNRWIIKIAVKRAVRRMVAFLNTTLGGEWFKYVDTAKRYMDIKVRELVEK